MTKPRLLDLYCGGGGAARGYDAAGFEVTGVDLNPMPDFPYRFIQGDAIEFLKNHGHEYDVIHASPPCQVHSSITKSRSKHLDLIPETRQVLESLGVPWVIENVVGSGLRPDLVLCGTMFGLKSYRHRLFESSEVLMQPAHPKHEEEVWFPHDKRRWSYGLPYDGVSMIPVYGNNAPARYQYMAMGIDPSWMRRKQMINAIPPAFTECIGGQLIRRVE